MNRLMVRINCLIVRTVNLGPVAIRIENIKEKGVGNAVPPGTAFNIADIAGGRHDIQQIDDIHRCRHPEGDVMQPRAGAVGKGDVVNTALAMHPGSPQMA